MYLNDVVLREPHPDLAYHAQAMQGMRALGMPVPGLLHLFNFRPRAGRHLCNWTAEVLRGPGALTPAQRERIGAWTSARNQCPF